MIPEIRESFNENYQEEFYINLQNEIEAGLGEPCTFRVSETPVFITKELKTAVFDACDAIIEQLWNIDFSEIRDRFIPKDLQSPSPMGKPDILAIDFGLCDDGNGGITPQLIELQAFPTLFFYQPFLGKAFYKTYPTLPKKGFHYFFSGLDAEGYLDELRKVILNGHKPENVILLEVFPEKQKTRIDFWATKKALGIEVICMTKVIKEGKKLFYEKDGQKIPIHRIYNRVIVDELNRIENLQTEFNLHDELEVEWCTHPDWFFVISKCIMPLLKHKNVPESYYLNDFPSDLDFSKFVLKPLFSFAGQGINLHPTKEITDGVEDKHNYILQQKVQYKPLVKTTTAKNSKVELRMLYIWSEEENRLKPVINLTRMSKGEMINVSHQVDETWIGSSISFFED